MSSDIPDASASTIPSRLQRDQKSLDGNCVALLLSWPFTIIVHDVAGSDP
jgi:hypothetical protein